MRLILLFIGVPIIEMALLVRIGQEMGFWPTIGLIMLTGLLGSILTRQQGSSVWHQFNAKLQSGQLPGKELIDGLIVLVAGALLLTPGVVTDFVGFLGLLPFSRKYIRQYAQRRLKNTRSTGSIGFQFNGFGNSEPFNVPNEEESQWQGTAKTKPDYND